MGDGLCVFCRNMGFVSDPKFTEAIKSNFSDEDEEFQLRRFWRFHTLVWAARQALRVEGDFVELGVYFGFMSKIVADYVDFASLDRQFYLFDTFEGVPEGMHNALPVDESYYKEGAYEFVQRRFREYENVTIIKGVVPDSIPDDRPAKIAYLHVDLNSAKAEIQGLEKLFDRVTPGGVVIFDDYGFTFCREQFEAENKWFAAAATRSSSCRRARAL